VVLQAVQDALIDAHEAEWTTVQRDAHDSIKWLLYFNEEAVKVCSLAGLTYSRVRTSARKVLAPLVDTYREKARLCLLQAENLPECPAREEAAKKSARYTKSADLIEGGL
jgi:hypothetical protein